MTVAELKKLWEPAAQGKIMRWNQVRPSWPDREIHLFGAGVDSGTFDYFTEAIIGKMDASRGDYTSSEDDNVIVQGVSGDENALGYFGYAYYEQNKDKLKLVAIDDGDDTNGKGPIAAVSRNGEERHIPAAVEAHFHLSRSSRRSTAPKCAASSSSISTKGVPLIREVGYIPLSDREYELVRSRFTRQEDRVDVRRADATAR